MRAISSGLLFGKESQEWIAHSCLKSVFEWRSEERKSEFPTLVRCYGIQMEWGWVWCPDRMWLGYVEMVSRWNVGGVCWDKIQMECGWICWDGVLIVCGGYVEMVSRWNVGGYVKIKSRWNVGECVEMVSRWNVGGVCWDGVQMECGWVCWDGV